MEILVSNFKKCDDMMIHIVQGKLRCRFLDIFFKTSTHMGSFGFVALVISLVAMMERTAQSNAGIYLLVSMLTTQWITQTIKILINRARPNTQGRSINFANIPLKNYSFPSGHTAAAFSLATALSNITPFLALLYMLASTVAVSRIYLGVHYPSDVLAGMIIGTAASGFVFQHYDIISLGIEVIL
jgi:undecaprenyl-diphosphatase